MLPASLPLETYRSFRRDIEAQRPAIMTIAARHGLPSGELAPFSQGTQIVWGTPRSVIKLFVPTWPADSHVEILMLERMVGIGGPRDELTRYTTPETGAYYFVPPVTALQGFATDPDDD